MSHYINQLHLHVSRPVRGDARAMGSSWDGMCSFQDLNVRAAGVYYNEQCVHRHVNASVNLPLAEPCPAVTISFAFTACERKSLVSTNVYLCLMVFWGGGLDTKRLVELTKSHVSVYQAADSPQVAHVWSFFRSVQHISQPVPPLGKESNSKSSLKKYWCHHLQAKKGITAAAHTQTAAMKKKTDCGRFW